MRARVCVCVCMCACLCVRACMRVCVRVSAECSTARRDSLYGISFPPDVDNDEDDDGDEDEDGDDDADYDPRVVATLSALCLGGRRGQQTAVCAPPGQRVLVHVIVLWRLNDVS